jgi:hypothetical protein
MQLVSSFDNNRTISKVLFFLVLAQVVSAHPATSTFKVIICHRLW